MNELPAWVVQYGLPGIIIFLLFLNLEKITGGIQKILGVIAPSLATRWRASQEKEEWRREQAERGYTDTVKALNDVLMDQRERLKHFDEVIQKREEQFQTSLQELEDRWHAQFTALHERHERRENELLKKMQEMNDHLVRIVQGRGDEIMEITRQYERGVAQQLDLYHRQCELLASQTKRLDTESERLTQIMSILVAQFGLSMFTQTQQKEGLPK